MIKKISLGLLFIAVLSSCVAKKTYKDLESRYEDLKNLKNDISNEKSNLEVSKNQIELERDGLKNELDKIKLEREKLQVDYDALNKKWNVINGSYTALEKNSGESIKANLAKNRELLEKLEAKEKALAIEQEKLDKNNKRLQELETLIPTKDLCMKKLKETLSKALNNFEGKGLTVEQKNGKVYVSMENKLLFKSGSWTVGPEGRVAAVEVGKVLSENPDISVLIEGHTDNDAFIGSGAIADNWNLSTKRATEIVAILSENKEIIKQNITAAGRGEFSPLVSNNTPEGRAKNRRIEIILTPKLDAIADLLNETN